MGDARRERGEALSVLRGDETTWTRVLDAARSRSLFAPRRVWSRRADALKGEGDGLAAYLTARMPSGVVLVLIAAKVDKRRSVWKAAAGAGARQRGRAAQGSGAAAAVSRTTRRRRLEIEPQGVEEIVARVGQDLGRVMGELTSRGLRPGRGRLAAGRSPSLRAGASRSRSTA